MKRYAKIENLLTPGDLVRVKYSPQDKFPKTGFYLGIKDMRDTPAWGPLEVSIVLLEDGTLLEVDKKHVQRLSAAKV